MPYTTDPAERAILDGFQLAANALARGILCVEGLPQHYDEFALARAADRFWRIQAQYMITITSAFRTADRSPEFYAELDGLCDLIANVVPDYPALVDWDTVAYELTRGQQ